MKYKKQKTKTPKKPTYQIFTLNIALEFFKFCPNYEQQKNERQCFQIKLKLYIRVYNYDIVFAVKIVALFTKHFQEQPTFCIKLPTPTN